MKTEILIDGRITKVIIDGKEYKNIKSIDFNHKVGEIPCMKVEFVLLDLPNNDNNKEK